MVQTSYPYLRASQIFGLRYSDVLLYSDGITKPLLDRNKHEHDAIERIINAGRCTVINMVDNGENRRRRKISEKS